MTARSTRAQSTTGGNAGVLGGFLALLSAATFALEQCLRPARRAVRIGAAGHGDHGADRCAAVSSRRGRDRLARRGHRLLAERDRGAGARRHSALCVGALLQLPRHAGDRHQSRGAGAADQSHLHARGRDLDPGRDAHAAAGAGDRADPAGTGLHHAGRRRTTRARARTDAAAAERIAVVESAAPATARRERAAGGVSGRAMPRATHSRCFRRPAMG